MEKLTEREERLLSFMQQYIDDYGFPPTVREMMSNIGEVSTCTIHRELQKLEEKGYIKKDPAKPRAITIENRLDKKDQSPVPLVKEIFGKEDLLKEDNIDQYIICPFLTPSDPRLFAKKMEGNFLVDHGIQDGDILYFEISGTVENNKIAATMCDGIPVIGLIADGKVFPGNSSMHPIVPDCLEEVGKLAAVFRDYRKS